MESSALIDEAGCVTLAGIGDPVPWWSFTKTALAIAALRLAESGALALDEPLVGARYSLRQLLRHEAGLPDYGASPQYHADVAAGGAPWPIGRLITEVDAGRLLFEPGTGWAYSNIGYLVVRRAIERATGLPLAEALRGLVFEPAGSTTARLASTRADLADVEMGEVADYHPGWVYHGLAVGTLVDAARLLSALMRGRLLRPETLAAMLERRPLPEHRSARFPDPAYGLGLMLWADEHQDNPIGHSGEGPGSRIAIYARRGRIGAAWTSAASDPPAEAVVFRLLS